MRRTAHSIATLKVDQVEEKRQAMPAKKKIKEDISDQDDDSTPPTFWRASENAVEATDLAEPATFQDTTSKPDQVHWRKAIRPELESMRFPVALCCQVDEQPTRYRDQLGAQD